VRSVYCQSTLTNSAVLDTYCSGVVKPSSVATCNTQVCALITENKNSNKNNDHKHNNSHHRGSHNETVTNSSEIEDSTFDALNQQPQHLETSSQSTVSINNSTNNSTGWSPLAWILVGWASMLLAMAVWQTNMRTLNTVSSGGDSQDSHQTQPHVNQAYEVEFLYFLRFMRAL
jgi:hypothetical protein